MPDSRPLVRHVIPQLSLGGASRALIGLAKYGSRDGSYRHDVLSLDRTDQAAVALARDAGLEVRVSVKHDEQCSALSDADIIVIYYWNSPRLASLLFGNLPPMRSLSWYMVNGSTPPHIISPLIASKIQIHVASAPDTLTLPLFKNAASGSTAWILAGADFERLAETTPSVHNFTVGYIGTIDFAKMHPDFIELCSQVADTRFVVCGSGPAERDLKSQAARHGISSCLEFRGYAMDIGQALQDIDVFGYPLSEDNYSAGDLVLQEVMYAGVPPVILPHGGARHLVVDGECGLVAKDENDYVAALVRLRDDTALRQRLGRNAAAYARRHFGARVAAQKFEPLYHQLMKRPKSISNSENDADDSLLQRYAGAGLLIRSLAEHCLSFRLSIESSDKDALHQADQMIANSGPAMSNLVLECRAQYPTDGYLALWSALLLRARDRRVLAFAEFNQALQLDCPHPLLVDYMNATAREIGATDAARNAIQQHEARRGATR